MTAGRCWYTFGAANNIPSQGQSASVNPFPGGQSPIPETPSRPRIQQRARAQPRDPAGRYTSQALDVQVKKKDIEAVQESAAITVWVAENMLASDQNRGDEQPWSRGGVTPAAMISHMTLHASGTASTSGTSIARPVVRPRASSDQEQDINTASTEERAGFFRALAKHISNSQAVQYISRLSNDCTAVQAVRNNQLVPVDGKLTFANTELSLATVYDQDDNVVIVPISTVKYLVSFITFVHDVDKDSLSATMPIIFIFKQPPDLVEFANGLKITAERDHIAGAFHTS
ncbi:hypothetical protein VPNG_06222 [Cytospora leucostoma]|uniref:Uncharacterized protein n=1 Tax=Cytospora leucostoma TaxID=1230097 RepID=A0A423WYM8_9PEZI|nr:hypothetical protein VPNG_06222 [Cytospora leucostoma]